MEINTDDKSTNNVEEKPEHIEEKPDEDIEEEFEDCLEVLDSETTNDVCINFSIYDYQVLLFCSA